jgi:7-cyano-7-deazaguanine synthase
MKEEKFNLVLLLSGGLDSALLLEMALELHMNPFCLLINYGQKHVKELEFAKKLCEEKQVEFEIISIKNLNVSSKLIDGTVKYPGVSEWHVPGRNLMFISIAASVAESYGIPLIWYGANYEDRDHLFPDCYQEWVYATNKVLAINGSAKIQLEAPLLGMDKSTVKMLAHYFGINEKQIFSGYGEK